MCGIDVAYFRLSNGIYRNNNKMKTIITTENLKRSILVIASTLLSLALFTVLLELYLDLEYESWKSSFEKRGRWNDGITMISDNPDLMWEYRPNAESMSDPVFRTNRHGFRDDDHESTAKPPDVYRVSFIGDSVTLGLSVSASDNYVSMFRKYALDDNPGFNLQAMNHGIDGYNAVQVSELLASRVLQYAPDKVVYVICLNDFDFQDSSGGKIRYFNKPENFVLERIERLYREALDIDFHRWHFNKNRQKVFDTIVEMKQQLDSEDIPFQVVIMPILKFSGSSKGFSDYPVPEIHAELGRFLEDEQIEYIDLLEAFRRQKDPPAYFRYDVWHPNEAGHDFIAKQLLPFVITDI